ncbi:lytic transglycosylase domain-containing protein [Qipengyuania sp. 483]|nr:transglycosylase [Erythrobacter sp.]
MEINSDGSRWIAGGQPLNAAASTAHADYMAALVEVPAEVVFPDNIVGDPTRHAAGVPDIYRVKVAELAARFDLSPSLIEAMVWQESRWRHDARSPAGARGLAQLMPGTARDLGVDPGDPFANLEGGARYLRQQLDRFDGDLEKALAAYNAGPGRVERANGIPRIRETQLYVASIMGRLADHSRE